MDVLGGFFVLNYIIPLGGKCKSKAGHMVSMIFKRNKSYTNCQFTVCRAPINDAPAYSMKSMTPAVMFGMISSSTVSEQN